MIAAALSALAEPNRLRMAELMRAGPCSVGQMAGQLGLTQPQTSKHLRVLSRARLVESEAVGNRRIYRLRPQTFAQLTVWLETFVQNQEERYERLDAWLSRENGDP